MNKLVLPVSLRDIMNELVESDNRRRELLALIFGTERVARSEEDILYDAILYSLLDVRQSIEIYENMAKRKGLL